MLPHFPNFLQTPSCHTPPCAYIYASRSFNFSSLYLDHSSSDPRGWLLTIQFLGLVVILQRDCDSDQHACSQLLSHWNLLSLSVVSITANTFCSHLVCSLVLGLLCDLFSALSQKQELAKISNTTLNQGGDGKYPCLGPDLRDHYLTIKYIGFCSYLGWIWNCITENWFSK